MSSFFGLNQFNDLVHITEVDRGLACQCRCVACLEPLVARQGQVRDHHFAHASNREACESSYESLLHRYAKQLVVKAGGLVAPLTPAIADHLLSEGMDGSLVLHALGPVQEEVTIGEIRPDLLLVTYDGVQVAVEIAYSSFCGPDKVAAFEAASLAALEIDLGQFDPEHFDPAALREAVLAATAHKKWIWPTTPRAEIAHQPVSLPSPAPASRTFLPEEIITISGRWISVKQLPSGDIAVRVVAYDPDVVSLVRSVCKQHGGRFNHHYKSWNVPRWGSKIVRQRLRDHATRLEIGVTPGPASDPASVNQNCAATANRGVPTYV
jgi:competence protein CoiA